jgi:hypothetical protein
MSSALGNRFIHEQLDPDVDDWRERAIGRGLDPRVVSFIAVRPALLAQTPGESPAYPTPRSWEMLSDVIRAFGAPRAWADLVPDIIDEAAAVEFTGFIRRALSERDIMRIIAEPATATLPDKLDGIYLLTSWLSLNAGRGRRGPARPRGGHAAGQEAADAVDVLIAVGPDLVVADDPRHDRLACAAAALAARSGP